MSDGITMREADRAMTDAEAVIQQLRDLIGEDPDLDLIKDTVEGQTNLLETIEAVVRQIGMDGAHMDALKTYERDLAARRKRFEKRQETMRNFLAMAVDLVGASKKPGGPKTLELAAATITLKATAPTLIVTDESAVPSRFFVTPDPVMDRKALLDALKARDAVAKARAALDPESAAKEPPLEDIPGATLSNGGQTVQIRVL